MNEDYFFYIAVTSFITGLAITIFYALDNSLHETYGMYLIYTIYTLIFFIPLTTGIIYKILEERELNKEDKKKHGR